MKPRTSMTMRQTAIRSRRRPPDRQMLFFSAGGDGMLPEDRNIVPTEIRLEATDDQGELALWLTDDWWVEVLNRWAAGTCTLVVQPTPGAVLHPAVHHAAQMLIRVAPTWRVIGTIRGRELCREVLASLAQSHYHEIRVMEEAGAKKSGSGRLNLGEAFGEIRRIQQQSGRSTPVLVRTAEVAAAASAPSTEPQHVQASQC